MATPDYQLPVFSFRPNWAKGITERLSWLTDILASRSAAEQCIALRLTPRRSFEAELLVEENERTFVDLFIRRFGADEFTLPIWHDHATLTASAAVGAVSLSLDTTNREFVAGGMAILMGRDALSCEAVRIDTVLPTAVTLIGATGAAWSRGTVVHPLRRGRFSDLNPSAKGVTDDLLQGSFQFQLSQANNYDGGAEELTVVDGLPVLSPAPDWSETLDLSWARKAFSVDNKVGIPDIGDLAGRGFSAQSHRWMLEGRDALASFYRLLYRLRGRQGALWLPSFQSDLRLAADAAVSATYVDIEAVGLGYIGALVGGRERALTSTGAMLHFSGLAAQPLDTGVERLNLSTPLTAGLAAGDVLQFVDSGRLDSDDIEIFHVTDSDGVTQVAAPFRTFPDVRNGSAAGAVEIPVTAMNTDPCGCAAAGVCALEFEYTITNWNAVTTASDFNGFYFVYTASNGDVIDDRCNPGGVPGPADFNVNPPGAGDSIQIYDAVNGVFRFLVLRMPNAAALADETQFQIFHQIASMVIPQTQTARVRKVQVDNGFIVAGTEIYSAADVTLTYTATGAWYDLPPTDVSPTDQRFYFNTAINGITSLCPGSGPDVGP